MRGGGATLAITLVALALLLARPSVALAHNTGSGQDVGFARISAAVANGVATVDVQLTEASTAICRTLKPTSLAAQRADVSASGSFSTVGDCLYRGTLTPPTDGRWVVTANFAFHGQPTAITLPIGIGGDVTTFQSTDWLHVNSLGGGGRSIPVGGLLLGAGGVLTLVLVVRVAKPRRAPRRMRTAARPDATALTAAAIADTLTPTTQPERGNP